MLQELGRLIRAVRFEPGNSFFWLEAFSFISFSFLCEVVWGPFVLGRFDLYCEKSL